jgi:hypothetical protein
MHGGGSIQAVNAGQGRHEERSRQAGPRKQAGRRKEADWAKQATRDMKSRAA